MPCVPLVCIRDYNLLAWRMNSTPRCHWTQTSFCCCLTACQHLKMGRFWPKKQHSRANWIWPLKWRKASWVQSRCAIKWGRSAPACCPSPPLRQNVPALYCFSHSEEKSEKSYTSASFKSGKIKNSLRKRRESVCLQNSQIPKCLICIHLITLSLSVYYLLYLITLSAQPTSNTGIWVCSVDLPWESKVSPFVSLSWMWQTCKLEVF